MKIEQEARKNWRSFFRSNIVEDSRIIVKIYFKLI